jgi:hypothetical protein
MTSADIRTAIEKLKSLVGCDYMTDEEEDFICSLGIILTNAEVERVEVIYNRLYSIRA